jgi:hypothetical protein
MPKVRSEKVVADPTALADRLPTAVQHRLRDHPTVGRERNAREHHTAEPNGARVCPEELSNHG